MSSVGGVVGSSGGIVGSGVGGGLVDDDVEIQLGGVVNDSNGSVNSSRMVNMIAGHGPSAPSSKYDAGLGMNYLSQSVSATRGEQSQSVSASVGMSSASMASASVPSASMPSVRPHGHARTSSQQEVDPDLLNLMHPELVEKLDD